MAVVITGFGARTPLGCSYEESLDSLRTGRRCVDDIRNLDTTGYPVTAAGEIRRDGEVMRTGPAFWTGSTDLRQSPVRSLWSTATMRSRLNLQLS